MRASISSTLRLVLAQRALPRLGLVVVLACALSVAPRADDAPTLKITSPLGRTGLPGTIRIVARLESSAKPTEVRFYVDKMLLSTDIDGAPYDALWADDNPFESRELMVEAEFDSGAKLTDSLVLKPLAVTEAVEVSSVALDATVLDGFGHFVRDLAASEFEVRENDHAEKIDLVRLDREPSLFTLLVDSSRSMAARAPVVRRTAARLLEQLAPVDSVIVAPFDKGVTSVTGPTADRQTVLDAIAAIRPAGSTAILDSINQVATRLKGQQTRRAIVLITDGYDESSAAEPEAVIEALRESGISLYAIGVGGIAGISLKGQRMLGRLCTETGGRAWFPHDDRGLTDAYGAIAGDVAQRYLLTYTPSDQRRDGTWRAVEVRVQRPGLNVRTKSGYMAPIAPPVRASIEFTAIGSADTPVALTADQVVIRENGVEQKVDTFQEAVLPVTVMLALDSSGSMTKSAAAAQDAAREFVAALRPEDEIGMITFADKSNYIHSPTVRRDWTLQAIDEYKAAGGTALYDALYDSLAQVGSVKGGRRVVVVVTDGRDENAASNGPGSLRSWEDVLGILQKTEATVYAVGIGSRVDRQRLQQLAARSGGVAYFPEDAETLSTNYAKIIDELRRRYVVGFESTNRKRDGAWRPVEITTTGSGVVIRSRGGYFAPQD